MADPDRPLNTVVRKIDWQTLVYLEEGPDNGEHPAYQFSSKTFNEDDTAGVYNDD